jgi:hypothetical protein
MIEENKTGRLGQKERVTKQLEMFHLLVVGIPHGDEF